MNQIQDKSIALFLVSIMTVVSFSYVLYLSITMMVMISELKSNSNTYITIVNHNIIYEKEKIQEQVADVKSAQSEPVVEKKPEVKPVVAEKPKEEPKIDGDVYLLAQIINAEAKGEPYEGKVAVGNVVLNRVEHPQFPDTIKDVIFQKGQFQPVTNGSIYNKPDDEAIQAAKDAMSGKQIVGEQAIYFYNPAISTSDWIFTRKTIKDIGNHRFAH